jgi:RHS repeat-associated protein
VQSFGAAGREPITIRRDALGREIEIEEPGAPVNRLHWDAAGRLVERSRGELAMRWRYDADGDRAAIGYPDGTETTYSYDAGGFLSGQHHPAIGTIAFERDAAGRLVAATGHGMVARWRYEDGDLVEYELDADGRRRSAQLTRDAIGRVVAATVDGVAERFSYDLAGQLLSAETPDSLFSFSYDANGRLVCETSRAGTVEYEYDDASQLIARRGAASTAYEYDGAGRRVREARDDFSRTWRWNELGRLVRIESAGSDERATSLKVDALGELAEVNGSPLLWDTADPFSPLTWMDQSAVIGHGSPWALAAGGATAWLAPDWQGTIGNDARDPWGAAQSAAGPGFGGRLRLGYRGELEFDGETWLRNRAYDPASRSFLQPDPLAPVPGTACAANPCHYAANNPIGLSDPLGLRPITDAELQKYRDRMDGSLFGAFGTAAGAGMSINNPGQSWTSLVDAVYDGIGGAGDRVHKWANTPVTLPNSRYVTGIGNLAYGAYNIGSGIKMVQASPAAFFIPPPEGEIAFVVIAGYGGLKIISGGARVYRGGRQLQDANEHPTVKQTPLQYGKQMIKDVGPSKGTLGVLGGLPLP